LIIFEDGFPFLFKQTRITANGKAFTIYKFRTMKMGTPNVATHLLSNPDEYVLKIGKWLRKSSLDELPNLINIVLGDMVFIGPRPALYNQYDLIELRNNAGISKLKPGITGWAQVNGRDEISLTEKVAFEHEYLLRQSFFLDLIILVKTFRNVIYSKDVKH
jgi:O-antigen biosynthesis protein WbqP